MTIRPQTRSNHRKLSTEQKLSLFAGYLTTLMRSNPTPEKSDKFGLTTFDDDQPESINVMVERNRPNDDPVWDQVYINGEWCGNKCGGAQKLVEIFSKYF